MELYFDLNYPKNLADALKLLHNLDETQEISIQRTMQIDNIDKENSIVFLVDSAKKGLDIPIVKHFEDGYKVIAFKMKSSNSLDLFRLTLMTLSLWPKILQAISNETTPFVYTFTYAGTKITKMR
ncbi:MAG TPA: hypothetical protein VFC67_01770 [Prolixibacteraceae bacterium]|nr:hypothetical protein [Prolixibacteraceae bacterium]